MPMPRFLLLCLLLLLLPGVSPPVATAQTAAPTTTEDVLYLRNGSVLHGQRLLTLPAAPDVVRLQMPTRDVLVFSVAEIDSVRRQPLPPSGPAERRRGFGHYTELGALAARNTNSSVNTSAFSFQTVNGYRFRPAVFAGAGIGVDLYATQTILPVFGSLRGDLLARGPLRPFYFVDGGYGFNLTGRDEALAGPVAYAGGALWAAGLGLKVLFNNQTGFLVSLGYRAQKTAVTRAGEARQDIEFQRLALRAGFAF